MVKLGIAALAAALAAQATPVPFHFVPNRGQAAADAQFVSPVRNASVALSTKGMSIAGAALTLEFEGADPQSAWAPDSDGHGATSYYIGSAPHRWLRDLPQYTRVRRKLYPGIDVIAYGSEGRLEYDLIVAPGADPARVCLRWRGATGLEVNASGDLVVRTASGELVQKRPVLYQNDGGARRAVTGRYRIVGRNRVRFVPGTYDRRRALTIDPVLESATLLGGSGDEHLTVGDVTGYVIGSTSSTDFPGIATGPRRGSDIFVYSPSSQNTLIVGGAGDEVVTSASGGLGPQAYAVIGGYTNSRDLPTVSNTGFITVPQAQYGGGDHDGFVLLVYGTTISLSTYLGGSGDDRVLAVDLGPGYFQSVGVTGATDSPDFPLVMPWQAALGGGLDGFVATFNLNGTAMAGPVSPLTFSSYVGGAGDDRVFAISTASTTDLYLGGETGSPDGSLPGQSWRGSRRGPSDGFLLHAQRGTSFGARFAPVGGAIWGGSGADRVSALSVLPNGNLATAGVTASSDFTAGATPLSGLRGATDAFVAVVSPDLANTRFGSLIGGSGDEEPLAIATNRYNEVAVGGWTSSTDFPLADPIQSQYGGGASDGFLVLLDSAFRTMWSTSYGGSGADRITYVRLDDGARAYFGGESDSADLPLSKPFQPSSGGGLDAFFGSVATPSIHSDGLVGGKDLAAPGYASLGDPAGAIGTPLSITSSDPAHVLVSATANDAGQAAVTVAVRAAASDMPGRNFFAYCLDSSGIYTLTLSAPGFADRTIDVRCVPSAIIAGKTEIAVTTAGNGVGMGSFTLATAAIDPDSNLPIATQNPRGGLPPVVVAIATSDANIVTPGAASATIGVASEPYLAPGTVRFTTNAIGTADLLLSAASTFPLLSDHVRVRVTGPALSAYVPQLARDFIDAIYVSLTPTPSSPVAVTVTSSDSSKLRVSPSAYQSGSASAATTCQPNVSCALFLESLEVFDGASVTLSAPGLDPVVVPIAFGEPRVALEDDRGSSLGAYWSMAPGQLTLYGQIMVGFSGYISRFANTPKLRPGAPPVQVQFATSDTSVATVDRATIPVNDIGGPYVGPVIVTGKTAGATHLSATLSVNGAAKRPTDLQLGVSSGGLTLGGGTVGRNLQIPITVGVPYSSDTKTITVTSSDSSRVLLSNDAAKAGQKSVVLYTQGGQNVYAQAIGEPGDVVLTASTQGYSDAKASIHVVPSGIAWSVASITCTTIDTACAASSQPPYVTFYALDPANLTPITMQAPAPGLGSTSVESANPGVAAPKAATVSLAPRADVNGYVSVGGATVDIAPAGVGETQITLTQPPGFAAPAGRGPLRVTVSLPKFTLSQKTIGRFMQDSIAATFPNGGPNVQALPELSFTSADPSKLLLSPTASAIGAGTAAVRRPFDGFPPGGSPYQPVYAQAIDGPADVLVTATAPGYQDATTAVQIVPTALAFATGDGPLGNVQVNTDLQSGSPTVRLYTVTQDSSNQWVGGSYDGRQLWAGFPSTPVAIANSNPSVATIEKAPVINALTNVASVSIKPLAPGTTELTLANPPGFGPMTSGVAQKVTVSVSGPSFVLPDVTALGRDLQVAVPLSARNAPGTIPSAVDVIVTSSDPDKVLVSSNGSAVGAGSATIHFAAGQPAAATLYVQALADAGTVTLRVSAPGYADTAATVSLAKTTMLLNGPTSVQVGSTVTFQINPFPAGGYAYTAYQFRPGITPFNLDAAVQDSSILTVSPAHIAVTGGPVSFSVAGVAAGATTLSLSAPDPYVAPAPISVTVQGGYLSFSGPSTLGKDLVGTWNLTRAGVTVTSSDPSRVLLSTSATGAGQASVTASQGVVYAYGLTASGQVTLTASAPGYQTATAQVTLAPAAVVFQTLYTLPGLTPSSPPVTLTAMIVPWTGSTSGPQQLRPAAGAVTVPITLSDATLGSVSPAQVVFQPGDSTATFSFQPRAAGTETISLAVPAGFADPLSARQMVLSVTAARATLSGALAVGKDLAATASVSVSGVVLPVTARAASSDPARLKVGAVSTAAGATADLTISSSGSATLVLEGLDGSGSANVDLVLAGAPAGTFSIALQPSGFRFANSTAFVANGNSGTVDIASSMLAPGALTLAADQPLRSDLEAPVTLTIASSNSAVLAVSTPTVTFHGGDSRQRIVFVGKSPGFATLTIAAPAGWSIPTGANKMTIIVQ